MNKNIKRTFSLILSVLILVSCCSVNGFAQIIYLTDDEYGDFEDEIPEVGGTVIGEYRLRYRSNILDRIAASIVGRKSTSQTTKVVYLSAYESSSNKVRLVEVDALRSSDGSVISGLSQENSSTAWKSKDANNATWYATQTGISGAITAYVRYECRYSANITYVGLPHLYNVG